MPSLESGSVRLPIKEVIIQITSRIRRLFVKETTKYHPLPIRSLPLPHDVDFEDERNLVVNRLHDQAKTLLSKAWYDHEDSRHLIREAIKAGEADSADFRGLANINFEELRQKDNRDVSYVDFNHYQMRNDIANLILLSDRSSWSEKKSF